MVGLPEIRRLLEFQRTNGGSMQLLLDFIAEDTFKSFSPISVYAAIVRSNGAIFIPFHWGYNSHLAQGSAEPILDENTPGYDAYKNIRVVEAGNYREYAFYRLDTAPLFFPNGFESSLILPIPDYGVILMFSPEKIVVDETLENLLRCVGEIASLSIIHVDHGVKFEVDINDPEPLALLPLTPRQWAIKDAMLRGLTNGAIAREMNFSESLIRHETIRIYSKLGINGRKELFTMETQKREA